MLSLVLVVGSLLQEGVRVGATVVSETHHLGRSGLDGSGAGIRQLEGRIDKSHGRCLISTDIESLYLTFTIQP